MDKLVIAMNIGSTSKKYAIYRGKEKLLDFRIEKGEDGKYVASDNFHDSALEVTRYEYEETLAYLGEIIRGNEFGVGLDDVEAILMRIVAPGSFFQEHRPIDADYFEKLEEASYIAPLHLALQRTEYDRALRLLKEKGLDGRIGIWGISDSAFHKNLPAAAYRYGIARSDADELEIRRFGYHGLSCAGIVAKAKDALGSVPRRVIVAHLGGGASITAIKGGVSIDTSMGMTPLEGLLMARRSGDLDPGALLALMEARGWSIDEARAYLNNECGIRGVSGESDDLRIVLDKADMGVRESVEAAGVYAHHARKYIGAALATLGGCDLFVFTGATGERSPRMRARILGGLKDLGIEIDDEKNHIQDESREDGFINTESSLSKIWVAHTDEFRAMIDAYHESKTA